MARLSGIFGKSTVSVALALGMAAPALADQGPTLAYYPATGAPSPAQVVFSVPVRASIGGSCTFASGGAPAGTYAIPGFIDENAWTNDFLMKLVCTGPSRMAIVSTNGGLLNSAGAPASGYTNLAPYTVAVSIFQNVGSPVTGSCLAADLTASSAAACTLRGTASPTVGLQFQPSTSPASNASFVRVSAPAYGGVNILTASATNGYSDTLVVTVSPAS